MFLQTKAGLCGNGLHADVWGSTPLAPAGLILSTDARLAIRRQRCRSDLCGAASRGFYQGLTGLEGVNKFTAVKASLKRPVLKDMTLVSDESL